MTFPRPRGEKHVRLAVKLLQLLDETQDRSDGKLVQREVGGLGYRLNSLMGKTRGTYESKLAQTIPGMILQADASDHNLQVKYVLGQAIRTVKKLRVLTMSFDTAIAFKRFPCDTRPSAQKFNVNVA